MGPISTLMLLQAATVLGAEPERWPKSPMSELGLVVGCQKDPGALQQWFPPHHLKTPLEKPGADKPGRVEELMARKRCYAGGVLRSYQEPVLAQGTPNETYRLIWSPSFESTVVVRVEESDGKYLATVKRDVSKGSNLTGDFTTVVKEISASDFAAIRSAAQEAGCWEYDHTCHAELSIERGPGGAAQWVVVDGDSWLLEGARAGVHWGVTVDSPVVKSPFMDVCETLVKAARAENQVALPSARSLKTRGALDGGSD